MSAAKVSDRTAKGRLLALAAFLVTLPEGQFNFGSWGDANAERLQGEDILKEPELCGTKACALGWAAGLPFARKLGFALKVSGSVYEGRVLAGFTRNGRFTNPYKVAKSLFGMSKQASHMVFIPSDSSYDRSDSYDRSLGDISPSDSASASEVAEHIRQYVRIRYA